MRLCAVLAIMAVILVRADVRAEPPAGISLEKGRRQLNKVLEDCPQLRGVVPEGGPCWNWLVSAFGDARQGFEIRWTRRVTPSCENVSAESSAYPDDGVSYVRVDAVERNGPNQGRARSPDAVMSGLVFELNNVRLGREKKSIADQAAAGRMDRTSYIQACAREEYTADLETAVFYRDIWLPYCHAHGLTSSSREWYSSMPPTFERWIARFPATFWYPWGFYGSRFDRFYGPNRAK
jgi:hypothetical protein